MLIKACFSCVVLGTALAAPRARAQDQDSSLFRRHQWGAEFSIASGFNGAGLLRFASPTRAWLVAISGGAGYTSGDNGSITFTNEIVNTALSFGTRSYHRFDERLYRLVTFGLSLNYSWNESTADTLSNTYQSFGGGLFGDIGATWMVTPHLGLGAQIGATLGYMRSNTPGAETDQVNFSVGPVRLNGQFYF